MSYFLFDNKRIYYHESGTGKPLLFLHGNTASSRMYEQMAEKYQKDFKVVLIDFLGHGQSDRLSELPADLWFYEAQQVIAFLKEKQYKDVNIIGSSGGAMVAMNVALEAPEFICKVIADSFEGEEANKKFTENLLRDRQCAKADENAREFYSYMHGSDWEQIVDNDTNAIIRHANEIGQFFHKPLQDLQADILFTGSREDAFGIFVWISSQGKQDFLDECVSNDDSFSLDDWVDGFEWIRISVSCTTCSFKEEAWVDLETM